jgi:hypothetical protein
LNNYFHIFMDKRIIFDDQYHGHQGPSLQRMSRRKAANGGEVPGASTECRLFLGVGESIVRAAG